MTSASASTSPTKPLSPRDINTTSPTKRTASPEKATEKDSKPKSMEYHRQVLQSRLEEDKSNQKYVSPSDTIMSPCTAKLSAYKSKHFMKAKPQSLFAKMEASKKAKGSEGVEGGKEGEVGGS